MHIQVTTLKIKNWFNAYQTKAVAKIQKYLSTNRRKCLGSLFVKKIQRKFTC